MASYNKFNNFVDALVKGGVNLSSDTIKVMLTNTAPSSSALKYSDISGTELAAGNGYTTGGATVSGTGVSNASGTESFVAGTTTFTSSGGNMGPFRYVVFYNSTAANQPLLAWFDYGASVTLNGLAGETFVLTPGAALFTLT